MGLTPNGLLLEHQTILGLKSYEHIFFDLDHTIWDFEFNSREAVREAIVALKLNIKNVDRFVMVYERINEHYWEEYRKGRIEKEKLRVIRFERSLRQFGYKDPQTALDFCEYYLAHSPYKTKLMDGAEELLDYLKAKSYRLHLITNGFREIQTIKVKEAKLDRWFEELIVSEDVGVKKPHPDIFHHALSITGTKESSSIMIGDNLETDIKGAHGVGIDQVFLNVNGKDSYFKATHEINNLLQIKEIL
ncbi:MAG TPA: noncanonical pyrimidine nucleotidase, YjjG family [Flavobacteriales bacterium]|nr:YjjG family noncanonical pyrimidine nucleotidase [Salibacteraceae bacterium]HAS36551.1 noncanonical pyrimidine nucleotidase, YjjG family [Flavobacteriales bacterium]